MIEVKNLSYSYDGKRSVLKNMNVTAEEGNLLAVLGPNGVGKSTLFKCILGLFDRYEGQILYNGRDGKGLSRKELAKEVAYIPQSAEPVYNYTVFDTVLMGTTSSLNVLSSPGIRQKKDAKEALKLLHIEHLAGRGIGQISGGERQLVYIARAIVQHAHVLVMDEPTANLDFGNQHLVLERVKSLTEEGYGVIMSTHNPDHALRYASHVLVLKPECDYEAGPVEDVLTEELIGNLYGIPVRIHEFDGEEGKIRSCIPCGSGSKN